MAFFSKQEIMRRMVEKRAESGIESPARADINLALIVLGSALFEKRLWSGRDYGEHPLAVGLAHTRSTPKIIIGLLHDVVEDSDWTVEDLRSVGFSDRVVAGVDAMTRREGEPYFDFIERCSQNSDAVDKKIDDISHNLDQSRADNLDTDLDMERINKYKISKAYLVGVKKGAVAPGQKVASFVALRPDFAKHPATAFLLAAHSSRPSMVPQGNPGTGQSPEFKP